MTHSLILSKLHGVYNDRPYQSVHSQWIHYLYSICATTLIHEWPVDSSFSQICYLFGHEPIRDKIRQLYLGCVRVCVCYRYRHWHLPHSHSIKDFLSAHRICSDWPRSCMHFMAALNRHNFHISAQVFFCEKNPNTIQPIVVLSQCNFCIYLSVYL